MGRKYKDFEDVETIMVLLDQDKTKAAAFGRQLGDAWTVLCDYKVYKTRPAKSYGIQGVPTMYILDAKGRIRQGAGLRWGTDKFITDLRLEAFWDKRRGAKPKTAKTGNSAPKTRPVATPPKATAATIRWVFHLISGGRLKVVSYEEKNGKYRLKLAAGSTSIDTDLVDRIERIEPKKK